MAVYLKLYGVGVIKKLVRDNISSRNESISQSTNESNTYGEWGWDASHVIYDWDP